MLLWSLVYGVPVALTLAVWAAFFMLYRTERKSPAVWVSLIAPLLSGSIGLWALTHVLWMAERAPTDYKLEKIALLCALAGACAAILWLRRSRQLCPWGSLGAALWLTVVWTLVLNPF